VQLVSIDSKILTMSVERLEQEVNPLDIDARMGKSVRNLIALALYSQGLAPGSFVDANQREIAFERIVREFRMQGLISGEVEADIWLRRHLVPTTDELVRGEFKFSLSDRKMIMPDHTEVKFTPQEFNALKGLVINDGINVSYQNLLEIMGFEDELTDRQNVRIYVRYIRVKMGNYRGHIMTIPGFGYKFTSDPDEVKCCNEHESIEQV
jgi:DNA-binding winged helix-turn-helix (wHTH) protein